MQRGRGARSARTDGNCAEQATTGDRGLERHNCNLALQCTGRIDPNVGLGAKRVP